MKQKGIFIKIIKFAAYGAAIIIGEVGIVLSMTELPIWKLGLIGLVACGLFWFARHL